ETLAETGLARQGKQIEQRHAQCPAKAIINACQEVSRSGRSAEGLQSLSASRGRQLVAKAGWQSGEHKPEVHISDVIGNDESGSAQVPQVFPASHAGPCQQKN